MKLKDRYSPYRVAVDGLVVLLSILTTVFLWHRSKYGWASNDESFYFTVAWRLMQGDSLLSQEWHLSQLSGFIFLPLLRTWMGWTTTKGIILGFRHIFLLFKLATGLLLYGLLRRRSPIAACICALVFMLFTPYGIYQLCYNSMGLTFCLLHGAFLVNIWGYADPTRGILSGVSLALAVLCCPYLLLVWVLEMLIAVGVRVFKREKIFLSQALWITVGAGISAVVFGIFVLSRASVGEIAENLPRMLMDPAHQGSAGVRLLSLGGKLWANFWYLFLLYGALVIALLLGKHLLRGKRLPSWFRLLYGAVTGLGFAVATVHQSMNLLYNANTVMIPAALLGLMLGIYMLAEKQVTEEEVPFLFLWVLGLLYGLLLAISSNQGIKVFANACVVSDVAAILLAVRYCRREESVLFRRILTAGAAALALLLAGVLCFRAAGYVFEDAGELDVALSAGPMAGLVTSEEHADEYNGIYGDMAFFHELPEGNVAVYCHYPWTYLCLDMPMGTYSGWSGDEEVAAVLSGLYYELHPEKIPQYIYIPDGSFTDMSAVLTEALKAGYTATNLSHGVALVRE